MIRRDETKIGNTVVEAIEIDLDAGTICVERNGKIVDGPRPLSLEERRMYGPSPLDAVGALATLLAVSGAVDLTDAANAVGLTPDDLVAEAQAWSVATTYNEVDNDNN